jgi:glycosyltransferase 2 family protein
MAPFDMRERTSPDANTERSDLSAAEIDDQISAEDETPPVVDLGRRFTDWRTPASFLIAIVILIVALRKSGVTVSDLEAALRKVNPLIFAGAFVVYYLSFPLRTLRWRLLMLNANTGQDLLKVRNARFKDLIEILYLSWFANCVIPAKLGDVYRAYLTRKCLDISASRTVGTILAERILDLLILFPLLFTAALVTFHNRLLESNALRYVLGGALALGVIAAVAILAIWRLGDGLRSLLPQRVHQVFNAFREGAVHSFRARIFTLLGFSLLIWICEGGRLYLVLASLGMIKSGELGPSAALFLALGSSVLTTLPVAPGGLGFVDTFLIATFKVLKHGATGGQAAALALLDRIVSYLSIVIFGFILYLVSSKTRAAIPEIRVNRVDGTP